MSLRFKLDNLHSSMIGRNSDNNIKCESVLAKWQVCTLDNSSVALQSCRAPDCPTVLKKSLKQISSVITIYLSSNEGWLSIKNFVVTIYKHSGWFTWTPQPFLFKDLKKLYNKDFLIISCVIECMIMFKNNHLNLCLCFRCASLFRKETRVRKLKPCAVDLSGSPRRKSSREGIPNKKTRYKKKRQHLSVTP